MPIKIKVVANPYVGHFEYHVNRLLEVGWKPHYESLSTNKRVFYMILTWEEESPPVGLNDLNLYSEP